MSEIVALGPAAIEGTIKPGDRLVALGGEPVATRNLDQLLEDTVGRRTVLTVETAGKPREVIGGTNLIDGSTLRLPGTRIQDLRRENMELHPRPVDVEVDRPLGEIETKADAQLERAVREVLKK